MAYRNDDARLRTAVIFAVCGLGLGLVLYLSGAALKSHYQGTSALCQAGQSLGVQPNGVSEQVTCGKSDVGVAAGDFMRIVGALSVVAGLGFAAISLRSDPAENATTAFSLVGAAAIPRQDSRPRRCVRVSCAKRNDLTQDLVCDGCGDRTQQAEAGSGQSASPW